MFTTSFEFHCVWNFGQVGRFRCILLIKSYWSGSVRSHSWTACEVFLSIITTSLTERFGDLTLYCVQVAGNRICTPQPYNPASAESVFYFSYPKLAYCNITGGSARQHVMYLCGYRPSSYAAMHLVMLIRNAIIWIEITQGLTASGFGWSKLNLHLLFPC